MARNKLFKRYKLSEGEKRKQKIEKGKQEAKKGNTTEMNKSDKKTWDLQILIQIRIQSRRLLKQP